MYLTFALLDGSGSWARKRLHFSDQKRTDSSPMHYKWQWVKIQRRTVCAGESRVVCLAKKGFASSVCIRFKYLIKTRIILVGWKKALQRKECQAWEWHGLTSVNVLLNFMVFRKCLSWPPLDASVLTVWVSWLSDCSFQYSAIQTKSGDENVSYLNDDKWCNLILFLYYSGCPLAPL